METPNLPHDPHASIAAGPPPLPAVAPGTNPPDSEPPAGPIVDCGASSEAGTNREPDDLPQDCRWCGKPIFADTRDGLEPDLHAACVSAAWAEREENFREEAYDRHREEAWLASHHE